MEIARSLATVYIAISSQFSLNCDGLCNESNESNN